MSSSLEAKLVILGAQNVGKTSLVHRFIHNVPPSPHQPSTLGASFLTKRISDVDTGSTVRLQMWDTAGQERFRSITKLYYRGANAALLCYDVTDEKSFAEMGRWLKELRTQIGAGSDDGTGTIDSGWGDLVIHVVGTKADLVAADPSRRAVPFERCIAYVAEQLNPPQPAVAQPQQGSQITFPGFSGHLHATPPSGADAFPSPNSNRSSGFWGQDAGWDCCHEVSASTGEGVDEVFRVITRKLVEQRNKRQQAEQLLMAQEGMTPGVAGPGGADGYFDGHGAGNGSFRVGAGDKRRSWLGLPTLIQGSGEGTSWEEEIQQRRKKKGGRCC